MTIRAKLNGRLSEPRRAGASVGSYQLCKRGRNRQGVFRLPCPESVRITNGEAAGLSCEGPLTAAAAAAFCERCRFTDRHYRCGEFVITQAG